MNNTMSKTQQTAEERKRRFEEQKRVIAAEEEADKLKERDRQSRDIERKERILTMSKGRS